MSSTAILDSFLKKVNVDDTVVSEIIKATGLETIADFASAFTEANFEKELEVLCKAAGGDLLQTSRLRTAWRLSRTELDKACAGRIGIAVEDDWDAPLSDEVEIQRAKDFHAAYGGLSFDTESTPAASIVGRLFREFSKRKVSIMALEKVKSEADAKTASGKKQMKITPDVSFSFDVADTGPQDSMSKTCVEVLWRLQLLTNAWAMTGVEEMEIPEGMGTKPGKTRMCHLTEAVAYYQFVARRAAEHPGPEHIIVSWIIDRDRQTRSKARALVIEGLPWGTALRVARETHCLVLWNVALPGVPSIQQQSTQDRNSRKRSPPTRSPRRDEGKKRGGKGGKNRGATFSCDRFNGKKGCTQRESDCPDQKTHKCSRCGHWKHGGYYCPTRQ